MGPTRAAPPRPTTWPGSEEAAIPTFVYSPGVKVYISTEHNGLVDVSEDVVEGNMVRRSDGISTFDFSVNNPQRKYDGVFAPNDRVVVVMKRLAWMRTFTGLLNSVPLLTAWPRTVSFSASCSLKRLQYWYWDSHVAATQAMIASALGAGSQADPSQPGDVNNLILVILDKVVGWPSSKVHLAKIPKGWMDMAYKVAQAMMQETEQDQATADLFSSLNATGVISGQPIGKPVNGRLGNGMYGGQMLQGDQLRIVETIYTTGKQMGMTDRDIVIGLITAYQESKFQTGTAVYKKDADSVGPFQQRPSQGWGTEAQCQDPAYAAQTFFTHLKGVTNRNSMQPGQAAQAVQRSAYPTRYQQWVPVGDALVQILNQMSQSNTPATSVAPNAPVAGTSTGSQFAQYAVQYVERYPNIPYSQGGGSSYSYLAPDPPPVLDCGTFVLAMYQRITGQQNGMPRDVTGIDAWVKARGGKVISVAEGLRTAGACMIKTRTHIEISVGNGHNTVGAHRPGDPASVSSWDQWDHAVLLPGLAYDGQPIDPSLLAGAGASTDPNASTTNTTGPVITAASNLPGYNPNDPFDKLFGNIAWAPENMGGDADANALVGIRALLNDQPLLPYLMGLFNSQMRSFCSAPNGDLIAWFPDYYGVWGVSAKMVIEPIEVQDFNVEWSDDALVTHQFTLSGAPGMSSIDVASGQGSDTTFSTSGILTQTVGVASIDIPAIMSVLFGINPSPEQSKAFADFIYRRFGARPNYTTLPGLQGPKAEFFAALFQFMRQWAYQYRADIPLTFMPEIYPGMLIQIPAFNFQAYVVSVSHSFRFGQGGMFTTSVNIVAPAQMPNADGSLNHTLIGMPVAGGFDDKGFGNIPTAPRQGVQAQRMDDVRHGGGQAVTR